MNGLLSGYINSPAMQRSFSPQPFAAPTVDPTLPWKQPGYSQPSQAYTPQQFTPSKADKKAALFKALGAMGPALIAGGAPSLTPGGGSQAIGQAGQLFNNAYDSHLQGVKGDQMQQYQMGRQQNMDRMAGEQHTAQMGQFARENIERQAAMRWVSSLPPGPEKQAALGNPVLAHKQYLSQAFKPGTPDKPVITEGADKYKYWATGPNAGQRVLPNVQLPPAEDKPPLDVNQIINQERNLDEAFRKAAKVELDQIDGYRRIEAIFQDPAQADVKGVIRDGEPFALTDAGAADLALIFNFMKMLDPGSVVREGEFALAEKIGGLPGWVQSAYEKVATGGRLSNDMRMTIVKQARNQYDSAASSAEKKLSLHRERAKRYGEFGIQPERALYYEPYAPIYDSSSFGTSGGTSVPVSGVPPRMPNPRAAEWLRNNPFPN